MRSPTRKFICIVLCMVFVVGFIPVIESDGRVSASAFFSDVIDDEDFWFTPAYWGATNNIVYGYSDGTFKPGNQCTRAQMVTFIWRIAGKPEPKTKVNPFSDIKKADYWYKPALWGNENGIVYGYKDGTFGPQKNCTRAQAVTFLWRLANKPEINKQTGRFDDGYELSSDTKETTSFSDIKKSDYFYKAVLWASEKGIVAGYDNGTFRPRGNCLRRQMVTFLYKFVKAALNGKIDVLSLSDKITMNVDIDYDAIDKALRTPTPSPTPTPVPKPKYTAGQRLGKVSEKQRGSFSLEGKNATEIFKMLKSYATISTGDKVSKYPKRFPVTPDTKSNGGAYCSFRYINRTDNDNEFSTYQALNCIIGVYCLAPQEMNDTFNTSEISTVQVTMYLNNYDVAAELYDKLYNYMLTFSKQDDSVSDGMPYDNRSGINWRSGVYLGNSCHGRIEMDKRDYSDYCNGKSISRYRYEMMVQIPIAYKTK